jgi:hypothetical protein
MKRILGLAMAMAISGCYSPNVPNGKLKCSTDGNKCPEGFHCATDGTCWKNGQEPGAIVDMAQLPDLSPPIGGDMAQPVNIDMGPVIVSPARSATSIMSGGVTAKSEHFKIIMSTGQPPGGNGVGSSTNTKKVGGLAGATQQKIK